VYVQHTIQMAAAAGCVRMFAYLSVYTCGILLIHLGAAELAAPSQPAPPCTHPGNIEHGLTDWNGTGNVARFACYQGYYLVGPPELKCRYGQWYTDAQAARPTCKPVVCSHPNIAHGTLSSGVAIKYKTAENAIVVCNPGYKLKHKSNNKIVCREDGSWSSMQGSEFPVCEERGCHYSESSNPDKGNIEVNGIRLTIGPSYQFQDDESSFGIYRPGSVMKHTCPNGWIVVPVGSTTRVCRTGRWDGQQGKCVKEVARVKPRGSCPPPPLINNGYFLSERYSGEKPYVLPVSGFQLTYEVGAVARYHCNEGYRLHMLFGQDIYRCTASGIWSPQQPPVCISRTNNLEPLAGMMCKVPEDIAYASYKAVEGVVTPNGALHGTILEYNCNIGYRDSILPCLPSRRTCHAGEWVGSLPSCTPFEFCPSVPRIENGYLYTPREDTYRLHTIIKYGCDRGFYLAGQDTMQCQATGCWEPNALPRCIDENLLKSQWSEETGGVSLIALLLSVCGVLVLVSIITAVCGVLACRKKRVPPPPGPAHWSTHVTVTPNCRNREGENGRPGEQTRQQTAQPDRVALIAFADQDPVVLPSYEEALRDGTAGNTTSTSVRCGRERRSSGYNRQHPPHRRTRHHQDHLPVQVRPQDHLPPQMSNGGGGGGYSTSSNTRRSRRHEPDAVSHHSLGWPVRQTSTSTSQSASIRSGSVQSVETVGNSDTGTNNTNSGTNSGGGDGGRGNGETSSQTPSCRALAGSLASFDGLGGLGGVGGVVTTSASSTEGVPLLEENEFESGTNSISEHGDTVSAYSDTSNKSNPCK